MIALLYLLLAVVRLFVSPIDRVQRKKPFLFRLAIFVFVICLAPPAQMIAVALGAPKVIGALVEVLLVIAVGEHFIFNDLERRGALPQNAHRLPLGV